MPIGKAKFFFKREKLHFEKVLSTQLSLQYAVDQIIAENGILKDYKNSYALYQMKTNQQLNNDSPVQDYLNDCILVEIQIKLTIRIPSKNYQTTIEIGFETPMIIVYYWLKEQQQIKEADKITLFSQNENTHIQQEYIFKRNDMIEIGFIQAQTQGQQQQLITIHVKVVDGIKNSSFTLNISENTIIKEIEDQVYVFKGLAKETCYIALFLDQEQQPFSESQKKQKTILGGGIKNNSTITAKISWYGGKQIIL